MQDCGASCIEVSERCMEEHTKTQHIYFRTTSDEELPPENRRKLFAA